MSKKLIKLLIIIILIPVLFYAGRLIIRAASLSVSETFDNPEEIASKSNMTICGGQIKLAEETWTTLSECNCNSLSGWYWYTTNDRSACWSKMLADSVSWNKAVGNDTDNPGAYTCATDVTGLQDRMIAVAAGEWYKIVSDVAGTTITSSHNGSAGWAWISALAISDCLDATRDLCTGDGCLGASVALVNTALSTWASATGGKSALPYCVGGTCSNSANNDFQNACEQNSGNDYPLACYENLFYKNRKVCGDGDTNYTWAAAAYNTTSARRLGYSSCSYVSSGSTSGPGNVDGFRAVVRP